MIIIALDFSQAKTGICVMKCNKKKPKILHTELDVTNTKIEGIERTKQTIDKVRELYKDYDAKIVVKESAIIFRASTGLPVIKSHGALEYDMLLNAVPVDEVHNSTIKARAKRILEENKYSKEDIKKLNKKEIVAKAIEMYYNKDSSVKERIYTERGKLIDDVADAIMLGIVYSEKINSKKGWHAVRYLVL